MRADFLTIRDTSGSRCPTSARGTALGHRAFATWYVACKMPWPFGLSAHESHAPPASSRQPAWLQCPCGLNGPLRSPGPGAWLSGDASSPADARAAPLHVRVVNRLNDAWRSPRTPVCGCRMAPKRRSVWQSRQLEDARRQRLRYDVTLPLCRLGCTRSRRVFATLPLCRFDRLAAAGPCRARTCSVNERDYGYHLV